MEDALELVQDERGQRVALYVLGDDQQRLFLPGDGFKERNQVFGVADLLFVNEDVRVFQFDSDRFRVGDEVRRQEAAIELHALHDHDLGLGRPAFLDRDDAVAGAHQLHRLGQFLADLGIVIGGDGSHLGDFLLVLVVDLLGQLVQLLDDPFHALLDAARQGHRISACSDGLDAFAVDVLGEDGGRGRAVARHVAGLAGRLLDQLGAHVLVGILKLDLLGHRDAVLGDVRASPALVEHGVAAAGT